MVILICIVLLIIILLQCRITLGFTFKMENSVCSAFITIYLFGNRALKKIMVYPSNRKKKKSAAVRKKSDFKQLRTGFFALTKLFKRSLILKEFKLYVKEGTGDAGLTAVIYGLLWNLVSAVQMFLLSEYEIKNKIIKIEPSFDEKIFKVDFDCIFSLKIVNIILMCKGFLTEYLKNRKGGDNDVGTSNRGTNDYSHAKY